MPEYLLVKSRNMKDEALQEFQDRLNHHAEKDGYELCELVHVSQPGPKDPPILIAVMDRKTFAIGG